MSAAHNENTRVKIPAILHLCGLGYEYLSLHGAEYDRGTNIFSGIFLSKVKEFNPNLSDIEANALLEQVKLLLDYEDLGKAFYNLLTSRSGVKLIDFEDFSKNALHVVTELPCEVGDDSFRPDITLLINGLPLVFIEVKKPNNQDGIQAEFKRLNARIKRGIFKKFFNITQLMVFSNNMEYADDSTLPL